MSYCRKATSVKLISKVTISASLITFLALFFALSFDLTAGDSGVREFVDLDGDGFNDFPQDAFRGDRQGASPDSSSVALFHVDNELSNIPEAESLNSSEFDRHLFSARALANNRCSLDSDVGFGPGNGIGSGIILSGCCVGGVCRPY